MFAIPQFLTIGSEIASIETAGALVTLIDVSADPEHRTTSDGRADGLWLDHPLIPYRSGGQTFFLCGAMDTYRYLVSDSTWDAAHVARNPSGPVRQSANNHTYRDYDHRIWPFGVWANGLNIYGMGHHEWYAEVVTSDGIPGYAANFGHGWVSTPIWMKSTNQGAAGSWTTKSYTTGGANAFRLFLVPEPWPASLGGYEYDTYYGFLRGTNIVYEDGWYYSFVGTATLSGVDDALIDQGFSMFRWSDLEDPTTTQIYNAAGAWSPRSGYQGNNAAQQPYIFFRQANVDPYVAGPRWDTLAQSIRFHVPTQQWTLWGYRNPGLPYFGFTRSKTLASPRFEENGVQTVSLTGGGTGGDYISDAYMTVFDPTASDQNFVNIGNNPIVVVADSHVRFKTQPLQINVTG